MTLNRYEQQIEDEFQRAAKTPGTAEYVSTKLSGPQHSCPHADKTKTRGMPKRLGFFRQTDGTMTYLDTDKVCQRCYDDMTPAGFTVWSTAYKPSERPMTPTSQARYRNEGDPDRLDHWAAVAMPTSSDYYPAMWQAGTEDDADTEPIVDRRLPNNAEVRELWRQLQTDGRPFYVDQLHLTQPWDPNAPDQRAEDARVARENRLAYENAARGYVETGVGGAGYNSIVEQRILRERAVELPARFGENRNTATHDETETETETEYRDRDRPELTVREDLAGVEVPTNWPEMYRMPSKAEIDAAEYEMTGRITQPTDEEANRRFHLE
ncbi:hypothetical protein A1O3_03780 [Capronia epimyces CBS 606.96]|uniref:Uncharacterized protein n=1 Tax=Capronia epimyces CBS 606.96 TaxID=1182542 RepID=W9YC42_9EURO|nr:uncharacterized protein A1O3_03780 [Capronia epimyces CBS 606.96]EXJ86826.1 hypothetical protein A1O3_03780 [Capronia epimyces CBS 606.96]